MFHPIHTPVNWPLSDFNEKLNSTTHVHAVLCTLLRKWNRCTQKVKITCLSYKMYYSNCEIKLFVWIISSGPPASAMWALGDKIASTIVAQTVGVPTLPWSGSGQLFLNGHRLDLLIHIIIKFYVKFCSWILFHCQVLCDFFNIAIIFLFLRLGVITLSRQMKPFGFCCFLYLITCLLEIVVKM